MTRIQEECAEVFRIDPFSLAACADRVVSNLAEYGNTSAASIPLALNEAVRSGRVQPGDKVSSSPPTIQTQDVWAHVIWQQSTIILLS